MHDGDDGSCDYTWDELRFSVSWKAYCFADEHEQRRGASTPTTSRSTIVVARLVDDLRARGRIDGEVPGNPDLGLMIIDEYIRFPTPA